MATDAEWKTYPDAAAWREGRKRALGASDAATLFGVGFNDEFTIWASKRGIALADDASIPMRCGVALEPLVIDLFNEEAEKKARQTPLTIIRRRDKPYLACSPDAWIDEEQVGLEAKAVGLMKASEWEDGIPLKYEVQTQHQMLVTGCDYWYIAALIGNREIRWARVERNPAFCEELEKRADAFWQRVVEGNPPEPTSGDQRTMATIFALFGPEKDGLVIDLPPDAVRLHRLREKAHARVERAQRLKDAASAALRVLMGDAERGRLPGGLGAYRRQTILKREYVVRARTENHLKFVPPKEDRRG